MASDLDGSAVQGDACAERVHAAEGAVAIAGSSEVAEFANAVREGGKHRVAMRNGFVTGRFDTTGKGFYGVEDLSFHDGESSFQFNTRRFVVGWMRMEISDIVRNDGMVFFPQALEPCPGENPAIHKDSEAPG